MVVENILSDRGSAYKRNVLVISFVCTTIWLLGLNLADVAIFGIQLPQDGQTGRDSAAWAALFAITIYQLLMLGIHGFMDWRDWRDHFEDLTGLPLKFALHGNIERGSEIERGSKIENVHRDYVEISVPHTNIVQKIGFRQSIRKSGRRRIRLFWTLEFPGPFLCGATCLFYSGYRAFPIIG